MTEENKKKPEDEIVGLDDDNSRISDKKSIVDKLKQKWLYGAIGGGVIVVGLVLYLFVFSGSSEKTAETPIETETSEQQAEDSHSDDTENIQAHHSEPEYSEYSGDSIPQEVIDEYEERYPRKVRIVIGEEPKKEEEEKIYLSKEDMGEYDIDTSKIIRDLDAMFIHPDTEKIDLGLSPEDSADTMAWLDKEMAKLKKERQEIAKKRKELEKLEYKVDQALIKIEQAETARTINLARLYDNMRPEDVAKLFANLPDDVVISIMPRMKPANASKILAMIPAKRAARLSTMMITVLEE